MNDDIQDKINTLERIIGWVENSDTKSSILMGLVGVFISMIFTSDFILTSLQKMIEPFSIYCKTGLGSFDWFIAIKLTTFFCFVAYFVFAFFCLFKSLAAKTGSKQTGDKNVMTNSLIHFGSIQKKTYNEFKSAVLDETKKDKLEDILSQIYINSKRCQEKFDYYNKSIKFIKIGIVLFILFIVLMIL